MKYPLNHVSFHGSWPILDLDIASVHSYEEGALNAAMRQNDDCKTIYERLAEKDLRAASVYHFPFRGVTSPELVANPTAWQALWDEGNAAELDLGARDLLSELVQSPAMNPPPQMLTVYYAGLDHHVHGDGSYPYGRTAPDGEYIPWTPSTGVGFLVDVTDHCLGRLIRLLEAHNLFRGAMFMICGDHGLSPVVDDSLHEMLLESAGHQELEDITDAAGGYEVLAEGWIEGVYNTVIAFNGGMAHVYVKNRVEGATWRDVPRFTADVLPLAQRFYDNSVGRLEDDTDEG